jgi:hypothetical protein
LTGERPFRDRKSVDGLDPTGVKMASSQRIRARYP